MKLIDIIDKDKLNDIQQLINNHTSKNEFEVSLFSSKETSSDLLTFEKYNNLISVLSIISQKEKITPIIKNTLDIILIIKNSEITNMQTTYRITIHGTKQINEYINLLYQRKNSLIFSVLIGFINDNSDDIENKNITIMKKTKKFDTYIILEDVYLKFKLDEEEELTKEEIKKLSNITKNYKENEYDILFRFKERTTYILKREDNEYNIDLTSVRTSKTIKDIEQKIIKKEIEIEMNIKNKKTALKNLLNICEFIIKTIQESNDIITKTTTNLILTQYKTILNLPNTQTKLYGRSVVSLEISHTINELPNKYSVTDKADGLRCQLFVNDKKCYLLTSNLIVKNMGMEIDEKYNNSILDGELILCPKYNKYLFMIFDCLVYGNKNIQDESNLIVRLEYADKIVEELNNLKYKHKQLSNKIDVSNTEKILDFHKNNLIEFYNDIDDELNNKKSNKFIIRRKYFINVNGIYDNEIFKYASLMWDMFEHDEKLKCPYHLDGLIFQPNNQKYIVEKALIKLFDYKWKPPSKNSIDFYVEFVKDKNGTIITAFDNTNDDILKNKKYAILNLYVGQTFNNVESPTLFYPEYELSQSYIYLDDNDIPRSLDGKIIIDKTVVEFYYDLNLDTAKQYKWIPLKTRYDKTESMQKYKVQYGNYITVAQRVWQSISNPILMSDINELSNDNLYIKTFEKLREKMNNNTLYVQKEIYYAKNADRNKNVKNMTNFNNWLKSQLIYIYSNYVYNATKEVNKYGKIEFMGRKNSVFEIACGRSSEIEKYYYAEIKNLVGIDKDLNGIIAPNGAIDRYKHISKGKPRFPKMDFINADITGLLDLESQEKILGPMNVSNKQLFEKYFNNENTYFDRAGCQFALHYFMESENTWNNFCDNMNKYMREGSYFICTLFDGKIMADKLKNQDRIIEYYTVEGKKEILYDIVKKFDSKDKTEFGKTISIHMSWISEDGVYLDEYIVDPDFLIKSLKEKCDFELVETNTFEQYYKKCEKFLKISSKIDESRNGKFFNTVYEFYKDSEINEKSRIYSFLNRYYVFKKTEKDLQQIKSKYY
jgi:hypothetical protein